MKKTFFRNCYFVIEIFPMRNWENVLLILNYGLLSLSGRHTSQLGAIRWRNGAPRDADDAVRSRRQRVVPKLQRQAVAFEDIPLVIEVAEAIWAYQCPILAVKVGRKRSAGQR